MRVHYFQHVPFEGLGSIEQWLQARDAKITSTRFYEEIIFPDPEEIDFLIVMGGPMSVYDEIEYPWLAKEKHFIGQWLEDGKPILGICLGAQLMASALGAGVCQNRVTEIGWFPIENDSFGNISVFEFPPLVNVFHWHGETFDLPLGATRLASSEGCDNQAFQVGRTAIGLQFHLETTPKSVSKMVENCRGELVAERFIQSEQEIIAQDAEVYQTVNDLLDTLLTYLLEDVGEQHISSLRYDIDDMIV